MLKFYDWRAQDWRWKADKPSGAITASGGKTGAKGLGEAQGRPGALPSPRPVPMSREEASAAAGWLEVRPRLGRDTFERGMPEDLEARARGEQARTPALPDHVEFLWAAMKLFDDDLPLRERGGWDRSRAGRVSYSAAVLRLGSSKMELEARFDTFADATAWLEARMLEDNRRRPFLRTDELADDAPASGRQERKAIDLGL